jgi:hypothetical protein
MADPPGTEKPTPDRSGTERPVTDLAAEAERARTPRTPFLALAGVWLTIVVALAIVLALVALTLYLVT